jgi:HCO3- transporter family
MIATTGSDGPHDLGAQHDSRANDTITRRTGRDVVSTNSTSPGMPEPRGSAEDDHHHPASKRAKWRAYFGPGGNLRPFRLLKLDMISIRQRWLSDWTVFNQQVLASSVYIFFTNLLPGITFASDLYQLTGQSWGTIEIVFSTGLCGIIFAM